MLHYYVIVTILFAHWFGDFVLQTDWQAKNKSSNNNALLAHIFSYTVVLAVVSYVLFNSFFLAVIWVLFNAWLHLLTDFWTSRLNSYLWKKGDVHNFFVSVGFDQFIHYICLFGTLVLFGV